MTTFRQISTRANHSGRCPACGERVTRSRIFVQTVSPYNRHEDGTPKSDREVWLAVRDEAAAWVPDFTHKRCALAAAKVGEGT